MFLAKMHMFAMSACISIFRTTGSSILKRHLVFPSWGRGRVGRVGRVGKVGEVGRVGRVGWVLGLEG